MEKLNMDTVEASLVIPLFNGQRYISNLLDSILRQITDRPFEILISDNGSSDSSLHIVEEFASNNANCKIIDSSSTKGKNFSVNNAVAHSSTEKLIFVDQDDELSENYIDEMSAALDEFPFVAASMDSERLNSNLLVPPRFAPRNQKIGDFAIKIAAGGTLGIKKGVFEKLDGFDEEFEYSTGDVDFCCRAHDAGYDLQLVSNAVLYYRFRESTFDNFHQGMSYGRGNKAIEKRFPGIRGPLRTNSQITSSIIHDAFRMTLFLRKDRQKVAHNLGKNVGYLLESTGVN
ncbi:MAG: glycosyltransferase family A protein [Chryseobacterium sp.]